MLGRFLDNVARWLARPAASTTELSRRQVLGALGAATLLAKTARATPAACVGTCPREGSTVCQVDLPTCTPWACCDKTAVCCATGSAATCCDQPNYKCVITGEKVFCEYVPQPQPANKCSKGFYLCGEQSCCPDDQTCAAISGFCCHRGRDACGTKCCNEGDRCIDATKGICKGCGKGRASCGGACCSAGEFCCNPSASICCPEKTGGCCRAPDGDFMCCRDPLTCARIADETGSVPRANEGRYMCCPKDRATAYRTCCPEGMKALGTFQQRAGAMGGFCCPKEQYCGSGKRAQCCVGSKELPEAVQECCRGVCMHASQYLSDPNNCGACGHACPKTWLCQQGVCVEPRKPPRS